MTTTVDSDIPIWPSDKLFPTLGWTAIDWIEEWTVHGVGDIFGQQTRLSKGKKRFLLKAYEIHPEAYCMRAGCPCEEMFGRRIIKEAVFSRIKGSAKTEFVAQIAHFELSGPCRFSRWDEDGEPIGQTVMSPYIPIAATSEEHAEDTLWGTFLAIAREGPLKDLLIIRERFVQNKETHGEAKVVNSSSIRNDGGKPSFTGIDEAHLFTTPELKTLGKALKRNANKRNEADPWLCMSTTMFKVGQRSLAEDEWDKAKGKNPDPFVLYDHVEAGPGFDTRTDEGLRAALLAAADDADWLNIIQLMRSYRDDEVEGERYWLNRYGGSSDKLVPAEKWRMCASTSRLASGDIVALGVDSSMFSDAAAVVACRLSDMLLQPLFIYYPDGSDEDSLRLTQSLDANVRFVMKEYLVTRVYADPPFIQELIAGWSSYGLTLKQKMPTKVVSWWTNVETRMAIATRSLVVATTRGECPHTDDAEFTSHMNNAYRREVRHKIEEDGVERPGYVPRKLTPKSSDKIDMAVAAILARQAATDSIEAGEETKIGKRKRSSFVTM